MATQCFESEKYLREKQIVECEQAVARERRIRHERRMLLGYFVISLLATLLLSGAFKAFTS